MFAVVAGVLFFFTAALPAGAATLYRNLKAGDFGEDVTLLQQILNRDPQTRVAVIGPGSPGSETRTFGQLTVAAVKRFQEKYAVEVLAPAGLTKGTGFVGLLTRKKLLNLLLASAASATSTLSPVRPVVSSPTSTSAPAPSSTLATSSNPNLVNIDVFIGKVVATEKARGVSDATIAAIANELRTEAATRGDYKKEFLQKEIDVNKARGKLQARTNNDWRDVLVSSFADIRPLFAKNIFTIPTAHALVGTPFGGTVVYIYPCTCSATALITVAGPAGAFLDYVYGTQAFLSYNLPYATFILGDFEPGAGETCYIYFGYGCTVIPSEGLISSVVGSSPE